MISNAQSRSRLLALLTLSTTLALLWLHIHSKYTFTDPGTQKQIQITAPLALHARRVSKASMLYGPRNALYERALQSHRRHAERWGYGMDILRNELCSGYWSKPAYLLALVIRWVDADSAVINPAVPVEIFLPPADMEDIHVVATKDHKGLNTGIFFVRVHEWTVQMLLETLGYPLYNPSAELGVQADQAAMEKVLGKPAYRESVMYLPRLWINTYEWAHAFEGNRGDFVVHFPGLGGERWSHMERWLDAVERVPGDWEVAVNETGYLRETEAFWARVRAARGVVGEYERVKGAWPGSRREREMEFAVDELRRVLYEKPFEGELLLQRVKDWKIHSRPVANMQLSVLSLLLSLGVVYFLTLTNRVLKNPLSSLPGPEVTKWTDLILKYHTVTGQRPRYVHALHKKYGPVVRIAPNTVDIADIPAARSIHRIASPFLKAPWYRLLNRKDGESIFSTTDPAFHRRHRRLLAPGLADAALRTVEPLVKSRIQLAVRRIRGEARLRGAADVYKWFLFMATDVIGELSFGESFRMLEKGVKDQYVMDLETVARIGGVRATFPVVVKLSGFIRLGVFREVVDSTDRILEYARVSVERYKRCLAVDPEAKKTLFTKLYAAGQAREEQGEDECLSDGEIRNDAQSLIVAGSDTTANTLTYLVWSVLRDKQVQKRLVAEIDGLFGRAEEVSDILLRGLPYMNQVIDETLRLYPAVPSGLPRIVPEQGSMLAGYWIPGGATVTTQLYSLHRDPEVFADPERLHRNSSRQDGTAAGNGVLLPRLSPGSGLNPREHE
ncbi:cytochrome P450 [Aspergillus aurantiobrunneus]